MATIMTAESFSEKIVGETKEAKVINVLVDETAVFRKN